MKSNAPVVEDRLAKQNLPQLDSPAAYLKSALRNPVGAGRKEQTAAQEKKAKESLDALAKTRELAVAVVDEAVSRICCCEGKVRCVTVRIPAKPARDIL